MFLFDKEEDIKVFTLTWKSPCMLPGPPGSRGGGGGEVGTLALTQSSGRGRWSAQPGRLKYIYIYTFYILYIIYDIVREMAGELTTII